MTVFDRRAAVPASACPRVPDNAFAAYKSRYVYNSRVQPSAVEAALARCVCVGKKIDNCVRGRFLGLGASLVVAAAFLKNVLKGILSVIPMSVTLWVAMSTTKVRN